jgi:hypothetical protein
MVEIQGLEIRCPPRPAGASPDGRMDARASNAIFLTCSSSKRFVEHAKKNGPLPEKRAVLKSVGKGSRTSVRPDESTSSHNFADLAATYSPAS